MNETAATKKIPIPHFQYIIEENEFWIANDDTWKQYHHWLKTEARCKDCGRLWKDRPKDAAGQPTDKPWPCEVRCGCVVHIDVVKWELRK